MSSEKEIEIIAGETRDTIFRRRHYIDVYLGKEKGWAVIHSCKVKIMETPTCKLENKNLFEIMTEAPAVIENYEIIAKALADVVGKSSYGLGKKEEK